MNKVLLIGRLTKDASVKRTTSGFTIAEFDIAVPGIKKDEATFIVCKAFGKTAEILEKYATKGKQVGIEGRINNETWEKDGKKNHKTLVLVDRIDLLGGKAETSADDLTKMPEGFEQVTDEEIPF